MNANKTLLPKITTALLVRDINGYSINGEVTKMRFHRAGMLWLRKLAVNLGMQPGTFEIRSNKGGMAGSGEVTLHGEKLYVQLYESCVGSRGVQMLFRSCKGRTDYCGDRNHTLDLFRYCTNTEYRYWKDEEIAQVAGLWLHIRAA